MTKAEFVAKLSDHQDDYEFIYNGKHGAICIFDNEIIAGYSGTEMSFKNLDELMAVPFLDGKSLAEVAEEMELYG